MPKEKCALCHEYKDLELSHIVPKFVIRHLKKPSFGAIRMGDGASHLRSYVITQMNTCDGVSHLRSYPVTSQLT